MWTFAIVKEAVIAVYVPEGPALRMLRRETCCLATETDHTASVYLYIIFSLWLQQRVFFVFSLLFTSGSRPEGTWQREWRDLDPSPVRRLGKL